MAQLTFLGTGTSTGVPQVNCRCEVCCSSDTRDTRLRTSALLTIDNHNILIDCGPDFRYQAIRAHIDRLDALLLTHSHYDHCGGLDDLRPYCVEQPFRVYAEPQVITDIKQRLPYCFMEHPYPGVPQFDMHPISPSKPFYIDGIEIIPLRVMHYKLPIVGYRIGELAYITDCLTMPQETVAQLQDLDVLVVNALRQEPHLSHQTLNEALALIEQLSPRRVFLIHMSHHMGLHQKVSLQLPPHVVLAYDMLQVVY